ncbi:MAG: non-ribosomal peptide synthetase, partial [Clostridia bacterium]
MVDERITIAEFVPAVLRNLVEWLEKNGGDLSFMRILICASDSWYAGEYRTFRRYCGPETRLINSFGLTEAAVDSCYFESERLDLASDQVVPIGRPFPNNRLYILDDSLTPVPVGVKGELYVAGLGLARGYLNRQDLTAERFLPDPFTAEIPGVQAGERMYKTGDLARFLPSGDVEFIGRKDYQVKVRGFRIEPGEIESVLSQHPLINLCAVDARQAPARGKELVAWLTSSGPEPPAISELRRFMQERLPDYMVPGHYMVMEAIPLTPNGKIDRRALPDPDWSQRLSEAEFIAPRTPVEEILISIWAEVLRVERISVLDNFFDLGGHSLLATQLVSRISEGFDIDAPLRMVFESPTIATQAEFIEIAQRTAAGLKPPPIEPLPRTGDDRFPLSFAQQRLWFLDQLQPNSPFYNIPESVRVTGPLDVDALTRAFHRVTQRHESLRTLFEETADGPRQHILPHLHLPISLIDLSALSQEEQEAEVRRMAYEEAQTPFNLSTGPLLRVKFLRLSDAEHVILFTLHHIISDNWSSNILITEVALLYDAFVKDRPDPLPLPPIQYPDFAVWQRNWMQGEVMETQLDFWRKQLSGAPPLLELPTDRPRPPVQTFRGDYLTFHLPDDIGPAFANLARKEGVTLFMAMLAAFDVLLYRYSGQDDISIGAPISGRTNRATENIIGFFVNTLVLRTDLSGDPKFRQLLQRVRNTALDAYAHQDIPFEMVVETVQPERKLSQSPLFQVMFALQNVASEAQVVSDLRIAPIDAHSGTAKFDLTLFMQEKDGQLSGALEFNTDLFDRATIQRMAGHFEQLLHGILAEPDSAISRLPLITDQERQRLLRDWNQTDAALPEQRTLPHLFEKQAAATPDAPAVLFGDQRLTYAELNARANQLAHFLQEKNVGPDDLVGVLMHRTPEAVIALLGILKAGAAYLPIDPTYPEDRIRFMLDDSAAKIVFSFQSSVFSDQETQLNTENSPAHAQADSASAPPSPRQVIDLSALNTENFTSENPTASLT